MISLVKFVSEVTYVYCFRFDDGATEEVSETLVFISVLIRLIVQEDFSRFIRSESFKSYISNDVRITGFLYFVHIPVF
jgi:hypothetical protein